VKISSMTWLAEQSHTVAVHSSFPTESDEEGEFVELIVVDQMRRETSDSWRRSPGGMP
jgi:hypothetical protein